LTRNRIVEIRGRGKEDRGVTVRRASRDKGEKVTGWPGITGGVGRRRAGLTREKRPVRKHEPPCYKALVIGELRTPSCKKA